MKSTKNHHSQSSTTESPAALASRIVERHPEALGQMSMMLRHPRSLSRPSASWRPPSLKLPRIAGFPSLRASVTRMRVGPRAQARVLGYGQTRTPAFLLTVRITDPLGSPVSEAVSEAWIRALLGEARIEAVHELDGLDGSSPTFVWLADGSYRPIPSPASLFAGFSDAA